MLLLWIQWFYLSWSTRHGHVEFGHICEQCGTPQNGYSMPENDPGMPDNPNCYLLVL